MAQLVVGEERRMTVSWRSGCRVQMRGQG